MNASKLANTNVMVVGGAGFSWSNLVKRLLELGVNQVHVVDNLLSAEKINVPDHPLPCASPRRPSRTTPCWRRCRMNTTTCSTSRLITAIELHP